MRTGLWRAAVGLAKGRRMNSTGNTPAPGEPGAGDAGSTAVGAPADHAADVAGSTTEAASAGGTIDALFGGSVAAPAGSTADLPVSDAGLPASDAAGVPGSDAAGVPGGETGLPGGRPWWHPRPFSRTLWYPVAGAAAVLALLAGGAMTLLTAAHAPRARPLADDCGLVTCGASLPPAVTGAAPPSTAARSQAPARRHHRRTHRQVLAPAAHSLDSPTPPALPHRHSRRHQVPGHQAAPAAVTVAYTLDGTDPWQQDFHAHLTIVNNGSTPVAGWSVQVSLPGDQVDWVGYPSAWMPFANWQFSGGTLTLNAVSGGETLAPGATEIVPITAQGGTTSPGGCVFNGSACQP
jgi:Cellulose binding domain